jgi:hypothetical protein
VLVLTSRVTLFDRTDFPGLVTVLRNAASDPWRPTSLPQLG